MALRIKEGIELEELEKYGFKYLPRGAEGYDFERFEKGHMFIPVDTDMSRRIYNTCEDELLYDLITAGIVVKE